MKSPRPSLVTVATVRDPNVIVTVELGEKLVPETVTGELTAPEVGLRLIPGLIVNVAEAECENASVAVTVWGPMVEVGTVALVLNAPVIPVLEEAILVVSNVIVMDEDPEKPDPVIVNEIPDGPVAGLKVMEATTVKVLVAVCDAASVVVTV